MANIKTMTVDSVTYNIQDSAPRTANKVVVTDANGELTTSDVAANKLSAIRNITAGTSDLTAGSSALATGDIYLVYE